MDIGDDTTRVSTLMFGIIGTDLLFMVQHGHGYEPLTT